MVVSSIGLSVVPSWLSSKHLKIHYFMVIFRCKRIIKYVIKYQKISNNKKIIPSSEDSENGNWPHLIGMEELCGSRMDNISKLGPMSGIGVEKDP